ncbi:MAG: class I SAM-dependent methyltransferase [Deltaproteobacteria bacterium]|nr:class I SAM-dependent methyltransferase [Deltaproteobacteria bacterium]
MRPASILEIGSEHGHQTKKLLAFAKAHGGVVHVIDPKPLYDVDAWQREHGDKLRFYREASLSALPRIEGLDLVLVDGDHNWYTVFNELALIEKHTAPDRALPLLLLHDVGWPYGRRDMYYDPEMIPAAYRKPYRRMGLEPGKSEPHAEAPINRELFNAVYENDLQNGVLTAAEDFVNGSKRDLNLLVVPGFFGLGLIVEGQRLRDGPELAAVVKELELAPRIRAHVEALETARLMEMSRLYLECERLELARRQVEQHAADLQQRLDRQAEQDQRQDAAIDEIEAASERERLAQRQITRLEEDLAVLKQALAKHQEMLRATSDAMVLLRRETARLNDEVFVKEQAHAAAQQAMRDIQRSRGFLTLRMVKALLGRDRMVEVLSAVAARSANGAGEHRAPFEKMVSRLLRLRQR